MDQQPNIPKINPEVNREEKKRSGWAGFFSRLGLGGGEAGGAGGAGSLGSLGSAGLSGGILATKAGIIGLALVGSTVAGSIGVVGYKLFGPGAEDRPLTDVESIFAPKPKSVEGDPSGSAGANGISASLDALAKANAAKESAAEGQAGADSSAPTDATAAAPAAASASASTAAPLKNDNAPGQGQAAKLKTDKKFGTLSQGVTSGSGGTAMAPSGGAAAGLLTNAKRGTLGAISGQSSARAGGLKTLASRIGRAGPVKQLGMVYRDQKGATSSMGAGKTYDGNAQSPSTIGPTAAPASGPSTDGAPSQNPGANPSGAGDSRFPSNVPPVTGTNVTPWQAAINTALMLVVASAALLFLAQKVTKMVAAGGLTAAAAKGWAIALASLAAICATGVIVFGSMIGGGQYGQGLQGSLLSMAGGCLLAAAGVAMYSLISADPAKEGAIEAAMGGNTQMLMYVCGGAALAACAWAYMTPLKKYDSSKFKDGRPCDWDNKDCVSQTGRSPSQGALDRYLA